MERSHRLAGECPKCGRPGLACNYNRFEKETLRIDSWEHKCADCGHRETAAYRSDDPAVEGLNVNRCPWCDRQGLEVEVNG